MQLVSTIFYVYQGYEQTKQGPHFLIEQTLIPIWISKHIHYKSVG